VYLLGSDVPAITRKSSIKLCTCAMSNAGLLPFLLSLRQCTAARFGIIVSMPPHTVILCIHTRFGILCPCPAVLLLLSPHGLCHSLSVSCHAAVTVTARFVSFSVRVLPCCCYCHRTFCVILAVHRIPRCLVTSSKASLILTSFL
jgi:hypothetical protein